MLQKVNFSDLAILSERDRSLYFFSVSYCLKIDSSLCGRQSSFVPGRVNFRMNVERRCHPLSLFESSPLNMLTHCSPPWTLRPSLLSPSQLFSFNSMCGRNFAPKKKIVSLLALSPSPQTTTTCILLCGAPRPIIDGTFDLPR